MSIDASKLLDAGAKAVELGVAIEQGRVLDAVRAAKAIYNDLLMLLPVDELKEHLRPEDRIDADLTADVYEALKLDGKKP